MQESSVKESSQENQQQYPRLLILEYNKIAKRFAENHQGQTKVSPNLH
jgi:hypothetical protein